MKDLVRRELSKVVYADLTHYDETTGVFTIPKYSKPHYELNKMYIVQVANELVGNNNSVLASNWNNGTAPKSAYLKIFVYKLVGKMIYVDSLVFNIETKSDTSILWSGWLPVDQLKQLAVL